MLANPPGAADPFLEGDHLHEVSETLLGRQTEALDDLAAVWVGDIFPYRVQEASGDVLRFQVGKLFEDLLLTPICRQERENIGHPDSTNAGTATALVGVDRDPVEQVGGRRHAGSIALTMSKPLKHKRKGPKSTRAGCLLCKPHKRQVCEEPRYADLSPLTDLFEQCLKRRDCLEVFGPPGGPLGPDHVLQRRDRHDDRLEVDLGCPSRQVLVAGRASRDE